MREYEPGRGTWERAKSFLDPFGAAKGQPDPFFGDSGRSKSTVSGDWSETSSRGRRVAKGIVTVCLPPVPIEEWEEALKAAMAPFNMNQPEPPSGEEPQGEWDWYRVYGGDGDTGLPVLAGHEDDPRIIHNPVFSNGRPRDRRTTRCDGGARGVLDFGTDRSAKAAEATAKWDAWSRFAAPYPTARPLDDLHRRFQEAPWDIPSKRPGRTI
ncbi:MULTISPECIES: hypothetical protein [Streptomyces]|uniref:hypothetical protein n=1 Tax=Streptomyces TaxID=1883 RepID=UPI00345B4E47